MKENEAGALPGESEKLPGGADAGTGFQTVEVGKTADLPPGSRKVVRTSWDTVLVLNVEGEFYAISNVCPHAGGYLNYGPLDGYVLECPLHYWPFDVRTGCLVGMDQDSLLDERLQTYPVQVQDGSVYVQVPIG